MNQETTDQTLNGNQQLVVDFTVWTPHGLQCGGVLELRGSSLSLMVKGFILIVCDEMFYSEVKHILKKKTPPSPLHGFSIFSRKTLSLVLGLSWSASPPGWSRLPRVSRSPSFKDCQRRRPWERQASRSPPPKNFPRKIAQTF